ncbi:uncharacterized protein LOC129269155 [Lytechinus pictus]|uniref:uncharacterized protein LOC129269155 n=1 Tax=Lytechinus pictus TaxID=7653 RepID=UPI0030B9C37E
MIIRIRHLMVVALIAPILAQEWQGDSDTCGRQYEGSSTMIVGGQMADEFEYPWQAAFYRGGRRICGASVIHKEWIITAAHCVDIIFEPEIFEFRVGSKSLVNSTQATQMRQAMEVYVHPDFNPSTLDYDIALFKMAKTFNIWADYEVNTVCLPKKSDESMFLVGQDAVVTGWGALQQGGPSPTELYEVTVPIYDQHECNVSYSGDITDNMICAGVAEGGIDSCQGDSGGPMVAYKNGTSDQYYLIGIVSWGFGCAQPDFPGVYTRVTEFEDWISPIFNGGKPTTKDGTCEEEEFLCRGGECIPDIYRCSGRGQCYHDTDEEFCDGLLKMFDVFYYERIDPSNISRTDLNQTTKEHCANTCIGIGCRAFDVSVEEGGSYKCEFAMDGYITIAEPNDVNRTFNHFVFQSQEPESVFNQAAGVIGSPSYFDTSPAPGNQRYTWTIYVPITGTDTIKFTILHVEGNATCKDVDNNFALLSIAGGSDVEKTSFCLNDNAMGAEFMIKGTEAIVEMMTSDSAAFGFLLEYEAFYDCDKVYTVAPGVVTSPMYPEEYPNSISCTTHLMAPEGEVVYFSFDEMNVEAHPSCIYDYVALYDGPDENAPLVGYYCGSKVPTTRFQSTGRDMFIKFSSDGSVVLTGFKAIFDFDIAREPTADPDIAVINSLESELSGYKFGMAAACILGALLVMVISASLYTVNKRDAMNAARVEELQAAAEETKPGYHKIEDEEETDNHYARITDNHKTNSIPKSKGSHGTQANKAAIIAETGHVAQEKANGDVNSNVNDDGGVINKGFTNDEGLAEEAAAAVAAFDAAVVESNEGALDDTEGDNAGYQTIIVAADVTPQPKENTENTFPHPPPADTSSVPPPPEETPPPPPPEADGAPYDEERSAL